MAVDEAIYELVGKGKSPATLRFYAWEPACLSLGYAQPYGDVDAERLKKNGWEVVRRLTGGRAILHTEELTYAVITGAIEPRTAGDILQSYKQLSKALLQSLENLGMKVESKSNRDNSGGGTTGPICFEAPGNYEIVADGRKMIGSAQARRKTGVLQHGTLPLFGDLTRITDALIYENDEERSMANEDLMAQATTVEAVLGRRVEWKEAARAFVAGFEEALNLWLEPGELSQEEVERAEELEVEKYLSEEWTKRR